MNFLFGHYAGSHNATTKAIATLQEIGAMFRTHTPTRTKLSSGLKPAGLSLVT